METNPPPMEPAASTPVTTMSLAGRMFNVFATPGEVFDEVKPAQVATANWLIPLLLAIVMGLVFVQVIYSQPAIVQQIQDQQNKAFEDRVKAGKMTREQADQAQAMMAKFMGPGFARTMAIVSIIVTIPLRLFWLALILWLLGRFLLSGDFTYAKALEVTGLSIMIMVLSSLVSMLLTVWLGKISTASLALFADQLSPQSPVRLLMQSVDFFDLWLFGVLTTALARLAGVPWVKAFSVILCYWLVMEGITVGLFWFSMALGSGFK